MRIPLIGGYRFDAAPCLVINPGPTISRRDVKEIDGVLIDDELRKAYLAVGSEFEEREAGGRGEINTFKPTGSAYVLVRDRAYPVNLASPPAYLYPPVVDQSNGHHPSEDLPDSELLAVKAQANGVESEDQGGPANIDRSGEKQHPVYGPYESMPWSWGVRVKLLAEERWSKARLFDRVAETSPLSSERFVRYATYGLGFAVVMGAIAAAFKVAGILPIQNLQG